MRLETTILLFREALTLVAPFSAKKATRPVLECLRIEYAETRATLAACDGEAYATVGLDSAATSLPGVAVVQLADIVPFLKSAEGHRLTIEAHADGESVTLSTDEGESITLPAIDPDEYPIPMECDGVYTLTQSAATLGDSLRQVLPACNGEDGRYAMNGVRLESAGKLVATDGRRLHIADINPATGQEEYGDGGTILPLAIAKKLAKLCPSKAPSSLYAGIQFGLSNTVRVSIGSLTLTFRELDGEFPHYGAVVPKSATGKIQLDSAETIKRMALVSSIGGKAETPVSFDVSPAGEIKISAKKGARESRATLKQAYCDFSSLDASAKEGFCLSPKYLSAAIKATGLNYVPIEWSAPHSPVALRSPGFLAVVMPVTRESDQH